MKRVVLLGASIVYAIYYLVRRLWLVYRGKSFYYIKLT
jgi:hypothetical protein